MTGISNDYYLPAAGQAKISETGDNSALGKDAFLKILITQLQNQDPTKPMDDKEFISQMAQFSSLEQMQNMTTAMENLLTSQQQTQMMSYTNFIGKEVKWHELTEVLDSEGKPVINEGSGVIHELKFVDGDPVFVLADGKEITPGNISSVLGSSATTGTSTTVSNPFADASKLIGQTIQYNSGDQLIQAIIEAITTKNGVIEYILNNNERVKNGQFETIQNTETTKEDANAQSGVATE